LFFKIIYMVQQGGAGNGNFQELDAIRMAANAFERDVVAGDTDQLIVALSVEEQRAVSAILDIVAEFAANRSAGSGNELEAMLVTPIAAKLPAGTHSQIIGEIFREVERRDRSGIAEFGSEQWERVKKEAKEERERLDKIADMADDANNGQLSTKPDQFGNSQQDYADLNNELKTRDGQDRYLAFLRMLHPNMTDAQIRERMELTQAVAAREASQPLTKRQEEILERTSPAEEAEIKGEVDKWNEMNSSRAAAPIAHQADAQVVNASANSSVDIGYGMRSNALSGEIAIGTQSDLSASENANATTASSRTSVTSQMDGQPNFSSAPSLRDHHRVALAATAPLDHPAPQVIASAAPVAPVPAVNAGFDV
jgi:hypothetical protein